MKNQYFLLVLVLLFPISGYGQSFADIPPSTPNLGAAPISFDLSTNQTPPAPAPAAPAPVTASSAVPPVAQPVPLAEKLPSAPAYNTVYNTTPTRSIPSSGQDRKIQPELLRSKVNEDHPFIRLMALPNDPQSPIIGKPLTVAQLLHGTYSPVVRKELLESYWELLGLLVEYNIRRESEQMAASVRDAQQAQTLHLFQQQRRSTEMEFIKKQWELSELLKRGKGIVVTESTLPIPCDYPVYKPYETYANQIARSEQAKYLARLLPVQQQLVDAKHKTCVTLSSLLSTVPSNSQQLVIQLNQRTQALVELTQTIVEYNQMIAQYTAETVRPNVSQYQLVGAVIELPQRGEQSPLPNRQRSDTIANPANPTSPRLSSLSSPEKNEETTAQSTAEPLPIETAATTFNKSGQPQRMSSLPREFPESESANPHELIAAEFPSPPRPITQTATDAPESSTDFSAEFSKFQQTELTKELPQELPKPPRMPRSIQQVSHSEKQ